ncbi:hypothetical protein LUZ62_042452 [Rhynchospora pubera]|uniref:Uncharacterized protein n=1 Tax=Rhynchospora pubera TaxID=906938 RepID=A0AAV8FJJ9_9POAL|nr:hypothetical protein LUZ62_042452 [Rhynchospora pubera]
MASSGESSRAIAGGRWVPTATSEVEWLKSEGPLNYTISMLADLASKEEDKLQSAIRCANILCIYFPVFEEVFLTQMREMGISFNEILIPSQQFEMFLLEPQVILDPLQIVIIVCTFIILMFKNVSAVNYDKFLNKRIAALRGCIGCPAKGASDTLKVMSFDVAKVYKDRVGENAVIRREVIVYLMDFSPSTSCFMDQGLLYTLKIISWSDMTVIPLMVDGMLKPDSPVLRQPEVAEEVNNLAEAIRELLKHKHPQFFRITAPVTKQNLVKRKRFPIIAAVAQKILADVHGTLNQFVSTSGMENTTVDRLYELHKQYLRTRPLEINQAALDFLKKLVTNFEEPLSESSDPPDDEWPLNQAEREFLTEFEESEGPLPWSTNEPSAFQIAVIRFLTRFEQSEEPLPGSTDRPNDTDQGL